MGDKVLIGGTLGLTVNGKTLANGTITLTLNACSKTMPALFIQLGLGICLPLTILG